MAWEWIKLGLQVAAILLGVGLVLAIPVLIVMWVAFFVRRWRKKRRGESQHHPLQAAAPPRSSGLVIVAAVFAAFTIASIPALAPYPWLAIVIPVAIIMLGLIIDSRTIPAIIAAVARRREAPDLDVACRCAGVQVGRTIDFALGRCWTDIDDDVEPILAAAANACIEAFRAVTGLGPDDAKPVRVLLFDDQAAVQRYSQPFRRGARPVFGYYTQSAARRVVACQAGRFAVPGGMRGLLTHELTHYLTHVALGRRLPMWITEGLAEFARYRHPRVAHSPDSLSRWINCLARWQLLLTGTQLHAMTYHDLARVMHHWDNLRSHCIIGGIYMQCGGLLRLLHEQHGCRLQQLLTGRGNRRWKPANLKALFGVDIDTLEQQWRNAVFTQTALDHVAPSDEIKAFIERQIVPVVHNTDEPADVRRMAIRTMAALNWAWGSSVLIDLVRNVNDPMHIEAWYALQLIAGEPRPVHVERWEQWYEQLPAEARS